MSPPARRVFQFAFFNLHFSFCIIVAEPRPFSPSHPPHRPRRICRAQADPEITQLVAAERSEAALGFSHGLNLAPLGLAGFC